MRTTGHLLIPVTCIAGGWAKCLLLAPWSLGACEWVVWELGTAEDSYRGAELLLGAEQEMYDSWP